MKTLLVLILLTAALAGDFVLWERVRALEATVNAPKDFPLGETMGYLQRYAEKIWLAGTDGNWDLADYYSGELGETADDVIQAHLTKEGVDVSKTMAIMLPPALSSVADAVKARNPALFRERYQALVGTCNACHQAAKHPFIQIAVPKGDGANWNQVFRAP